MNNKKAGNSVYGKPSKDDEKRNTKSVFGDPSKMIDVSAKRTRAKTQDKSCYGNTTHSQVTVFDSPKDVVPIPGRLMGDWDQSPEPVKFKAKEMNKFEAKPEVKEKGKLKEKDREKEKEKKDKEKINAAKATKDIKGKEKVEKPKDKNGTKTVAPENPKLPQAITVKKVPKKEEKANQKSTITVTVEPNASKKVAKKKTPPVVKEKTDPTSHEETRDYSCLPEIARLINEELDKGIPSITFDVYVEHSNKKLGLSLTDECQIIEVGERCGKLKVGDIILKLNHKSVESKDQFRDVFLKAKPPCVLTFQAKRFHLMDRFCSLRAQLHNLSDPIIQDDQYIVVRILKPSDSRKNDQTKMGFSVRVLEERVMVTSVDLECTATGILEFGDIVMDVDGKQFGNDSECRKLVRQAWDWRGFVTLGVCRPMGLQNLQYIWTVFKGRVKLPEYDCEELFLEKYDAIVIGRLESMRRRIQSLDLDLHPPKSILKTENSEISSLSFLEENQWTVQDIHTDYTDDDVFLMEKVKNRQPDDTSFKPGKSVIKKFKKFGNLFKKGKRDSQNG